jgi:hypothetical protein
MTLDLMEGQTSNETARASGANDRMCVKYLEYLPNMPLIPFLVPSTSPQN